MARRREEPVGVEADEGWKPPNAQERPAGAPPAAMAVSSAEKENGLGSVSSTGPEESGGVAVMVLGNWTGTGAAAPGESGWAVSGVSR